MFEGLFTFENLVALLTLTSLEIVLGIDNIVFLAILTGRLPRAVQARARFTGLALAMIMRVLLLFAIKWIMGLEAELFAVFGHGFTGKEVILLFGGLFLVGKATYEIHEKIEGVSTHVPGRTAPGSFLTAIVQILLIDLVFSLDSVITAVGMAKDLRIMVAAVIAAVVAMMAYAGAVTRFVERHPTIKMLALSFLILVGVMLIAEGWGVKINKGYIYFAMAFSLFVELLNLKLWKSAKAAILPPPRS